LSTNGKVFMTLVALFFLAITWGCSRETENTPLIISEKAWVSAECFVKIYLDLQRVDRKYSRVLNSFLKRNGIEGGEYRMMADSVFISSHPDLIGKYNNLTEHYQREKKGVFERNKIDVDRYEGLLLALANGEHPAWAESISAGIRLE